MQEGVNAESDAVQDKYEEKKGDNGTVKGRHETERKEVVKVREKESCMREGR